MKYKIGLLFIMFPVYAFSQTKEDIDSIAKSVLSDLVSSWTLGIDTSAEVADIRVFNKFKSLFNAGATIDDDFNASYVYNPQTKSGSYQVTTNAKSKAFDVYAHDVALQIRSITIDSVSTLDFSSADPKKITFTVRRRITLQKFRQFVLPPDLADNLIRGRTIKFDDQKDSLKMIAKLKTGIDKNPNAIYEFQSLNTIRITMTMDSGKNISITNIKSLANSFVCINDADLDAIPDQEDSLININKPGDFTANGKPDYDLDGVADETDKCKVVFGDPKNGGCPFSYFLTKNEFDGFVGLQLNAPTINLPKLNQLGYVDASGNDAIDVLQSSQGTLMRQKEVFSFAGGGNLRRYFGQKRKRAGISVGFTYSTGFDASYNLSSPVSYTFKSSDGVNLYRRRITFDTLNENIRFSILNIPVLFNFRSYLNKNHALVLNLQVGPSLMIINSTSTYDVVADFEGLYQFDPNLGKIVYTNPYDSTSHNNILFTKKYINSRNPSPTAPNDVLSTLSNNAKLDFAVGKNYKGSQQQPKHMAVAAHLNFDFQYKISEGLTIKVEPHFLYAFYRPVDTKYKPLDKTTDQYQSIYSGNAKLGYYAYGMNVGFVFNF